MANVEYIAVSKTARYHVLGRIDKHTREIWIVCHGYGYLAEFFVEHFKILENEAVAVVAPEALNRFYKNGT